MAFIQADNISYTYKKGKEVIHKLSLDIHQNQITAVVGENGSGKTTLGKLFTGILKPLEGKVFIENRSTQEIPLSDIGRMIGYLFQNPSRQIFGLTVNEQMLFVEKMLNHDHKQAESRMMRLLECFDLSDKRNAHTYELSQGEKQRLALASILLSNPSFLILDEPTTGLDSKRKKQLSNYLKDLEAKGIGMIIISHDRSFIKEHAQRVITLSKGEIIHDKAFTY